ncbi:hypothetical protein F2P81_024145 [Scophthalmus maximus]|uniref:BZIP domain-containing protein n=3 Tax=Scophthalmus maximus TaxID=52904 RepID=A0A6A4RTJ2_SCOMX|nr:hypothetical protein F2P81_024145 [Scophthalmus maximus]
MMPGQIPDPSMAAGSLPSLGPLAGISATTLTDQLKLADFRQLGTMLSPLHFLGRLGKRPLAIKTEMDEDEDRRKRRREKNKVAAARCRNKKKERTDFLQRESERLEMVNSDLKAQIEELRLERQQLMVMLNLHRPTCIVRTDSVKTPESEANPLLEQLSTDTKLQLVTTTSSKPRKSFVLVLTLKHLDLVLSELCLAQLWKKLLRRAPANKQGRKSCSRLLPGEKLLVFYEYCDKDSANVYPLVHVSI